MVVVQVHGVVLNPTPMGGTSFVDSSTAYNDVNDDVNDYLRSTLSKLLSIYDYRGKNRHFQKCISLAQYIPTSCSDNDNNVIPDSGATSTMMKHCQNFEYNYKDCDGAFILMGDASRVAVAGYGMCRMKINGNFTRVLNIYICQIMFSVTKHGRMDHSHSFILEGGIMNLLFPKFSITQPILKNNDLRIPLQPMSADDWSIPNYILDGDNCSDDYLNSYKN